MLQVLDVILNKSGNKFGFKNGRGKTYEAILTASSIQMAQRYYELLTDIKEGRASVKISEETKAALPDFPKFAITYSVTEDEEGSTVNQEKMLQSLRDYNGMFGTHFGKGQIQSYNKNLNKRLQERKESTRAVTSSLILSLWWIDCLQGLTHRAFPLFS